jgi:predicted Zn-dependent protease
MEFRQRSSFILLGVAMLALSGCATIYNPATGKRELILIDTTSEITLGNYIASGIKRRFDLSDDPRLNERAQRVGEKIFSVSDRTDLPYHFYVIKNKEPNAFALPGGFVYIHTGLLNLLDDDELACVLGHEVGHIAARHSVKKLQAEIGYTLLMNVALRKAGIQDMRRVINISFDLISLGYSREDELLADRLAVRYASRAGYNPRAMLGVLKKLEKKGRGHWGPLTILSSHPDIATRERNVQREIELLNQKEPSYEELDSQKGIFHLQAQSQAPEETQPQRQLRNKKFCPVCGKQFPASFNYCPQNGTKLGP